MLTTPLTALPPGEVTILAQSWIDETGMLLEHAVARAVDGGIPVVYAECGGLEGWGQDLAHHLSRPKLLRIVDDTDEVIHLPNRVSGHPELDEADVYALGTPTFTHVRDAVVAHTAEHGPCILILDAIERARPFDGLDENPGTPATLIQQYLASMTPDDVRGWRAAELRDIAADRPTMPTLAITYTDTDTDWLDTTHVSPKPDNRGTQTLDSTAGGHRSHDGNQSARTAGMRACFVT